MNSPIQFDRVDFAYPGAGDGVGAGAGADDEAGNGDGTLEPVFRDLSISIPDGFTFVVGPNGIGKSTLMLLASARLFPQAGEVTVLGTRTSEYVDAMLDPAVEERRNRLVSFVYQNMEFETELPIGEVLELVAENSLDPAGASRRFDGLVEAAGLRERYGARMQELSKGEMQRAIVAMSVLYGSPIVMMDEPVFAVEPQQAERLFDYLRDLCHEGGLSIYASVHDVVLAGKYADAVVLMHADGKVEAGSAADLLQRERLEEAFKAPWDTLYRRQALYREFLGRMDEASPDEAP